MYNGLYFLRGEKMKVSPVIKPPSLVALLEGKTLKALNLKIKEIQEEKEKEDEKRRLDILA